MVLCAYLYYSEPSGGFHLHPLLVTLPISGFIGLSEDNSESSAGIDASLFSGGERNGLYSTGAKLIAGVVVMGVELVVGVDETSPSSGSS